MTTPPPLPTPPPPIRIPAGCEQNLTGDWKYSDDPTFRYHFEDDGSDVTVWVYRQFEPVDAGAPSRLFPRLRREATDAGPGRDGGATIADAGARRPPGEFVSLDGGPITAAEGWKLIKGPGLDRETRTLLSADGGAADAGEEPRQLAKRRTAGALALVTRARAQLRVVDGGSPTDADVRKLLKPSGLDAEVAALLAKSARESAKDGGLPVAPAQASSDSGVSGASARSGILDAGDSAAARDSGVPYAVTARDAGRSIVSDGSSAAARDSGLPDPSAARDAGRSVVPDGALFSAARDAGRSGVAESRFSSAARDAGRPTVSGGSSAAVHDSGVSDATAARDSGVPVRGAPAAGTFDAGTVASSRDAAKAFSAGALPGGSDSGADAGVPYRNPAALPADSGALSGGTLLADGGWADPTLDGGEELKHHHPLPPDLLPRDGGTPPLAIAVLHLRRTSEGFIGEVETLQLLPSGRECRATFATRISACGPGTLTLVSAASTPMGEGCQTPALPRPAALLEHRLARTDAGEL